MQDSIDACKLYLPFIYFEMLTKQIFWDFKEKQLCMLQANSYIPEKGKALVYLLCAKLMKVLFVVVLND